MANDSRHFQLSMLQSIHTCKCGCLSLLKAIFTDVPVVCLFRCLGKRTVRQIDTGGMIPLTTCMTLNHVLSFNINMSARGVNFYACRERYRLPYRSFTNAWKGGHFAVQNAL